MPTINRFTADNDFIFGDGVKLYARTPAAWFGWFSRHLKHLVSTGETPPSWWPIWPGTFGGEVQVLRRIDELMDALREQDDEVVHHLDGQGRRWSRSATGPGALRMGMWTVTMAWTLTDAVLGPLLAAGGGGLRASWVLHWRVRMTFTRPKLEERDGWTRRSTEKVVLDLNFGPQQHYPIEVLPADLTWDWVPAASLNSDVAELIEVIALGDHYDFEHVVMDDAVVLRVTVTDRGKDAKTSGGPDAWEIGDEPDFVVRAYLADAVCEPISLGQVASEALAERYEDELADAVASWLEENPVDER